MKRRGAGLRGRPKRRRPRSLVSVGLANVNASDLAGLRRAWRHRQLVLFLGAGVSIPYGIPSWKNLVLELLFEQAQGTRRLGRLWPHYRRAVASWMTDYFDYDPLVLARMVERDLRSRTSASARRRRDGNDPFLEQLRKHLYANYRRPRERTTLDAIADLVASGSARGSVEAVVTFNFDDLLERALVRRGVSIQSITSGDRQVHGGVKVIHAHGYLPRVGPLSRCDIVFTELDYHRLTESVFHWGLSEIVEHLRKSTVLFIGLSMADPSLRRLLDASRNSKIPPHWQIQRRHDIRDHEMADAMAEVERRARRYATLLGSGREETKTPAALEDSIRAALGQADSYDRDVFEGMGVKTIWVTGFGEIADIVAAIARK
jgi:NAD-dependent SIR2 family protein deacetylase